MRAKVCERGRKPRDLVGCKRRTGPVTDATESDPLSFDILAEGKSGQPERRGRLPGNSSFGANLLTSLRRWSGPDARNQFVDS